MYLEGSKSRVQELMHRDTAKKVKAKKKAQFERDVEKSSFQVKILMKKDEAIQLLSKCKEGGILELEDVANKLSGTTRYVDVECTKKD